MKQPEYLRSTKALTPLLNTDAFYISTEKDPPSPGRVFFLPSAVSSQQLAVSRQSPVLWASRFRIGVVSQTGPQGHHPHIRQCQPLAASISSRILYITGYMIGGSWFVKACHYTRMGCDKLSLAGRLNQVGPYAQGRWPCVFCGLRPALISIACMRFRRGRPKGRPASG